MNYEVGGICPYCGSPYEPIPTYGGGWTYMCPNPACASNIVSNAWATANTADTTPPWEKNKDDKSNA